MITAQKAETVAHRAFDKYFTVVTFQQSCVLGLTESPATTFVVNIPSSYSNVVDFLTVVENMVNDHLLNITCQLITQGNGVLYSVPTVAQNGNQLAVTFGFTELDVAAFEAV